MALRGRCCQSSFHLPVDKRERDEYKQLILYRLAKVIKPPCGAVDGRGTTARRRVPRARRQSGPPRQANLLPLRYMAASKPAAVLLKTQTQM